MNGKVGKSASIVHEIQFFFYNEEKKYGKTFYIILTLFTVCSESLFFRINVFVSL